MRIEHQKSWRTGSYCELVVKEGTAEVSSGLLDVNEAAQLAGELREAADDLDPPEEWGECIIVPAPANMERLVNDAEYTDKLKALLEDAEPDVWVECACEPKKPDWWAGDQWELRPYKDRAVERTQRCNFHAQYDRLLGAKDVS